MTHRSHDPDHALAALVHRAILADSRFVRRQAGMGSDDSQVIFFAMARKITSCTFMARSIAAFE